MEDWDWYAAEHEESILIKPVEPVAVYSNRREEVAIRQRCSITDSDQLVCIPKERIVDLIVALRREMNR